MSAIGLEVDMIATAHEQDLLTTPYVFNEGEARGDGARLEPISSSATSA